MDLGARRAASKRAYDEMQAMSVDANDGWIEALERAGLVDPARALAGFRFDPACPEDMAVRALRLRARSRGLQMSSVKNYAQALLGLGDFLRAREYPLIGATPAELESFAAGVEHYRGVLACRAEAAGKDPPEALYAKLDAGVLFLYRMNRIQPPPHTSDIAVFVVKSNKRVVEQAQAIPSHVLDTFADRYLGPNARATRDQVLWASVFLLMYLAALRTSGLHWVDTFLSQPNDVQGHLLLVFYKRKWHNVRGQSLRLAYNRARPWASPERLFANIVAITGAGTTPERKYLVPQPANFRRYCTDTMVRDRFRALMRPVLPDPGVLDRRAGARRAEVTPHSLRVSLITAVRDLGGHRSLAAAMAGCSEFNIPTYTRVEVEAIEELSQRLLGTTLGSDSVAPLP